MATTINTKKKTAAGATENEPAPPAPRAVVEKPRNVAAYEAAVAEFASAAQEMSAGRYGDALPRFKALAARMSEEEPILADRARSYASICGRRMEPAVETPGDADALYHGAVFAANQGRYDEAMGLLDRAVAVRPNDASILYARASIRGLQGNVDGAAGELKRAVAIDPHLRFQAASDPDFEKVRDEAAFIDVIEPTGAGA